MMKKLLPVLIVMALSACQGPPPSPQARILRVKTLVPEASANYQLKRQFVGRVVAAQRVDVGFEQGGKIDTVLVNEGETVAAGQALARLDSRLLQVAGDELQAQLQEAEARLGLVKSSLKRQQSLQQQGFSARQQLDELAAEKQVLLATIQRLQASLAANQLRLDKMVLVAPYDGVISRRYQDQGAVVAAGSPLLQVLETARLEVVAGIPVTMAAQLEPGTSYPVRVGSDTFEAVLLAVGSDLNALTRTVKLRLALPQVALRDGELALLILAEPVAEQGFWLPVSALTDGMRGLWNSYALEPLGDGRYRVQSVNIGVLHVEEERAYVTGALADKPVIASGLHRVVPGQIVSIIAAADV